MVDVELYLVMMKIVTALMGFYIVYLGLKAYGKYPSRTTLWLTAGIAILTVGAMSEGLALQGLGWTQDQSHVFEGIVTMIGFAILVYSLFAK